MNSFDFLDLNIEDVIEENDDNDEVDTEESCLDIHLASVQQHNDSVSQTNKPEQNDDLVIQKNKPAGISNILVLYRFLFPSVL